MQDKPASESAAQSPKKGGQPMQQQYTPEQIRQNELRKEQAMQQHDRL